MGSEVPQAFINFANVGKLLSQANSNNVRCTLLMQADGALLSVTGETKIGKKVSALVSNMWKQYEEGGQSMGLDGLQVLVLDMEEGKLVTTRVSQFLLCMVAKETTPPGLLKRQLEMLAEKLAPLGKVYAKE